MTLEPSEQIRSRPWMKDTALTAVFTTLEEREATQPVVLFVGGCVRNSILEYDLSDIDLATYLAPDIVMKKLISRGIKALPTGIEHGTVTAVIDNSTIEITTLRRDVSTDGRRAVVAFTDDWREDAQRRDFTINTLLMDQDGYIYDPTGRGLDDLKAGHVRFVGDARARVQEDYLRILRFFRFYGVYGKGAPDKDALAACREFAGAIPRLSKERITQEFRRILMADDPVPVLDLMFENNVLPDLIIDKAGLSLLQAALSYPSRLLVLAAFREKGIERLEQFLILSKEEKRTLRQILAAFSLLADLQEKNVKLSLYRYGRDVTRQAVFLKAEAAPSEILDIIEHGTIPAFPLSGDDVKKTGVSQGPEIGRILQAIENWWIDRDFQPGRGACLEKLRAILPPAAGTSK